MVKIGELQCHIVTKGQGVDVVLLHGWGQNTEMMQFIQDHLQPFFRVTNLDFPGFGKSEEMKEPWSVQRYTEFLEEVCAELGIDNPILIGHSFGCRVAIRYAAKHSVQKMILTGAAGIRPKKTLINKLRLLTYKVAKKGLQVFGAKELQEKLKKKFGSADYKNASGVMRDTLVKVVQDDITDLLNQIECPVLLVWGDQDDATPLWMGKMMEKEMKNAGLAIFEGDGHYAYFNQSQRFCRILDVFLEKEKEEK